MPRATQTTTRTSGPPTAAGGATLPPLDWNLIGQLRALFEREPDLIAALLPTGSQESAGCLQAVLHAARQATAAHPENDHLRCATADAELRSGYAREAFELLRGVIANDRASAQALILHGSAALSLDDAGTAAESLQRAIAVGADYADVHTSLGEALLRLQRTRDAEREFTRALQINPLYARARLALGLIRTGEPPEGRS